MELFFDTTDQGTVEDTSDVRDLTKLVYDLMRVNGDTHAPPRCQVSWGSNIKLFNHGGDTSPWCVVESVTQELQLFSPDGVPLRARLNVTFRDAWTITQQLQETPRHTSDRTKSVVVQQRQTLSQIAFENYQNSAQWRPIADANQLDNPRLLTPGMVLKIPSLTTEQQN
jgi:nucleoid-associated protein YgaU